MEDKFPAAFGPKRRIASGHLHTGAVRTAGQKSLDKNFPHARFIALISYPTSIWGKVGIPFFVERLTKYHWVGAAVGVREPDVLRSPGILMIEKNPFSIRRPVCG